MLHYIGCLILSYYGCCTVYIALMASMVCEISGSLTPCLWMVIVSIIMAPLILLGTPKDFWLLAYGALGATVATCILTLIQIVIDVNHNTVPCQAKKEVSTMFL